MRFLQLMPLGRRHAPKRANPWEIAAASVSGAAAQARPRCAFVRGKRTAEPTLSSERWFLSGCYPKAMVDAKLRNPLQVSLGPDGLQRLFSNSGILTVDDVLKNFG